MANPFKAPKFADDEVVISWQSGALGDNIIITRGLKVRGNHPAVRGWPEFFVKDGTPESEWPGLLDAYFAESEKRAEAEHAEQLRKYPPVPADEIVICTHGFQVGLTAPVAEGSRHRRTDPLVKKYPQFFAEPPRPLVQP